MGEGVEKKHITDNLITLVVLLTIELNANVVKVSDGIIVLLLLYTGKTKYISVIEFEAHLYTNENEQKTRGIYYRYSCGRIPIREYV